MLHHVTPDRKGMVFCGPWVLSAITGNSVTVCEDALRAVSEEGRFAGRDGRRLQIRGVWPGEVKAALNHLGWSAELVASAKSEKMTLKRAYKTVLRPHMNSTLLVLVRGHYLAMRRGIVSDTINGEMIAFSHARRLRRRNFVTAHVVKRT